MLEVKCKHNSETMPTVTLLLASAWLLKFGPDLWVIDLICVLQGLL